MERTLLADIKHGCSSFLFLFASLCVHQNIKHIFTMTFATQLMPHLNIWVTICAARVLIDGFLINHFAFLDSCLHILLSCIVFTCILNCVPLNATGTIDT